MLPDAITDSFMERQAGSRSGTSIGTDSAMKKRSLSRTTLTH